MLIGIALRQSDFAIDHNGAIPMPTVAVKASHLLSARWFVDAQPTFRVEDVGGLKGSAKHSS